MKLKDLIKQNRSYRRFYQDHPVSREILEDLVDCARLSASARNLQPLRYILSFDPERNSTIFPHLGWAGYLTDWPGPVEGERPSAYIIICSDTSISTNVKWDDAIAAQTILLGATQEGLGGCIIGNLNRNKLEDILAIPEKYDILLIIALGKPKETVVIEEINSNGDIKYWRDEEGIHHVPKYSLKDIIIDLQ